MHDVCVIGHVTRDSLHRGGQILEDFPGGVPVYTGVALARLGLETAVITKLARQDEDLLAPLKRAGVVLTRHDSRCTAAFENSYDDMDPNRRQQTVTALAEPFVPKDLDRVVASMVHLGPLIQEDMSLGFLEAVGRRFDRVSLDVQGLVRRCEDGRVCRVDWPDKARGLAGVHIVKADLPEAQVLTGCANPEDAARAIAAWGPAEIIVTLGTAGAMIYGRGHLVSIPAIAAQAQVDPTGCGDSFMAGYLFQRLRSDDIEAAGRFGAALAAYKLGHRGPFAGREEDVRALM